MSKGKHIFKKLGNANTALIGPRFCLVPVEGHYKVANRFAHGEKSYGANNWKNGNWEFLVERINHLENHLQLFKQDGDTLDDNTGAMLWACYCIAWFQKNKPEEYKKAMDFIRYNNVTNK
jgi:hypothetical protein